MGRVPFCECGYIKIWHGIVKSSENSQHLFDWYTFTHIVHGFGWYLVIWLAGKLLGKRIPFRTGLILTIVISVGWEILENTSMVIERYREATLSLNYYGDSIINSVGDIIAVIVGYVFASRNKFYYTILLSIVLEAFLLWAIKDNLSLNILMLIHPVQSILNWQSQ